MNCISPASVRLPAQLTTETAESLVEDLSKALSRFPPGTPPHLVLHADDITWCGTAGVQPVVSAYRSVSAAGGTFAFAGCSHVFTEAMHDLGLASLFNLPAR